MSKQREMNTLNDLRFNTLEKTIKDLNKELSQSRKNFEDLAVDFQFNLEVIKQREEEINNLDLYVEQLRSEFRNKESEISDLKSKVAELQSKFNSETTKNNETEHYYQDKMQQLRADISSIKQGYESRIRDVVEKHESTVREFRRQLQERIDESSATKRETEEQCTAALSQRDEIDRTRLFQLQQQKQAIHKLNSDIESITMKNKSSIKLMEEENEALRNNLEDQRRTFDTELNEQERRSRKHHQEVVDTYEERIHKLHLEADQASQRISTFEKQVKMYEMECAHQLDLKDQEVASLKAEVEDKWRLKNKEIEQLNTRDSDLNIQVQSLQQTKTTLTRQLNEKEDEIRQLRDQLQSSSEQLKNVEKESMQTKLQTQADTSQMEKILSRKHDQNLKAVTKEKDDLNALVKDKNQHIEELQNELLSTRNQVERLTDRIKIMQVRPQESNDFVHHNQMSDLMMNEVNHVTSPKSVNFRSSLNSAAQLIKNQVDEEFDLEIPPSIASLEPSPKHLYMDRPHSAQSYNNAFNRNHTINIDAPNDSPTWHHKLDLNANRFSVESVAKSVQMENVQLTKQNKALNEKIKKLEGDHARVKLLVRDMKDEIEDSQRQSQTNESLELQVRDLKQQLSHFNERLSVHSNANDHQFRTSHDSVHQVTQLNSLMTSLKLDLEKQKENAIKSESKIMLLDKENLKLRSKVKEAAKDLKKLTLEKDKYEDISNRLKSQLDKSLQKERIVADEPERVEQLEHKVQVLQDKLRDVLDNNLAMRKALDNERQNDSEFDQSDVNKRKLKEMRDSLTGVSGRVIHLSEREKDDRKYVDKRPKSVKRKT
ncbi:laminin subunit alpha [Acrasis kona]|uniref:Laminin subunit alpha n=1 Tax=Acrasis kona TaxID=1008807 RepID=A0AAW2YP52_9EUKA